MPHEVIQWGRFLYRVSSASRTGMYHLVDLEAQLLDDGTPDPNGEPYRCDCESHTFNVERPCRHVRAVVRHLRAQLAKLEPLPEKQPDRIMRSGRKTYTLKPNLKYQR